METVDICGIVGLPNVGKSTLFNALLSTAQAEAANYPFCTIEPNAGRVGAPDERTGKLAVFRNGKRPQIQPAIRAQGSDIRDHRDGEHGLRATRFGVADKRIAALARVALVSAILSK